MLFILEKFKQWCMRQLCTTAYTFAKALKTIAKAIV
jgi:hypothetical protein